jgi:hypothetical protein
MLRARGHQACVLIASAGVAVASLVLYAAAVWFGNLNQDEGWYLYAARLASEGRMPYRDFFFTQGPVMPYVYGALRGLWSPYGVLGGRLATVFFGLLGCLFAAGLARRAVPSQRATEAGLIAFALTACNLYHVYFTTIPKTYALASCLLLGGYLLLSLCLSRRKATRSRLSCMWALPAGLLIAFAAGTRLSLGAVLPVTTLGLLVTYRKTGAAFFWFALGGVLGLALVYGPALLEARDPFVFCQSFHVERGGRDLFYMAGSLARTVRAYLPTFLLALALVVFRLFRGYGPPSQSGQEEPGGVLYRGGVWPLLWTPSFLAVFLVQLLSPFPYDDYQVPVMGLLAAALAGWAANSTASGSLRGCICLFWVLLSLTASFASPLPQEWLVRRQDRFWVLRKERSDLALLRMTARDVKALSEQDEVLLTQDLYLAVECGMRVPQGFEMGPFSYFPGLSDEAAARYHVMNKERLTALLSAAPCRVAAYSGYGLAIRAPVMDEVPPQDRQLFLSLLGQHYDCVQEVPDFGQNCTTLQIMKRRTAVGEPSP